MALVCSQVTSTSFTKLIIKHGSMNREPNTSLTSKRCQMLKYGECCLDYSLLLWKIGITVSNAKQNKQKPWGVSLPSTMTKYNIVVVCWKTNSNSSVKKKKILYSKWIEEVRNKLEENTTWGFTGVVQKHGLTLEVIS